MYRILALFVGLGLTVPGNVLATTDGSPEPWQPVVRPGFVAGDTGPLTGYTDLFVPLWQDATTLVFLNPRLVVTDSGTNEQNVGLGVRHLTEEEEWLLGANLFYDTRWSDLENRFHQVGLGVEALSTWVDVRLNYYHPFSKAVREPSLDAFTFSETNLLRLPGFEEPLAGLDYEAGVLLPWVSDILETRAHIGGFHFNSEKATDVQGWRFRLEARPTAAVTLEWTLEHTAGKGSDTFIGGFIRLPFAVGHLFQGKNPFQGASQAFRLGQGTRPLRERMTDRIVRDLAIVSKAQEATAAPETLDPVIFVDNTNDADLVEDGTKSHPHNTLAEALANPRYGPGVMVRLERGDGTAVGHTGSFTLVNNVTLWGSATNGGYRGIPITALPPILDGGGATVLTLAANNIVQGMQIQNGGNGIFGTDVGNLIIRNNTFTNNTLDHMRLDPASGIHTILIQDNVVSGGGVGDDAIDMKPSGTAAVTTTIVRNIITGVNQGIVYQPENNASGVLLVAGNQVSGAAVDALDISLNNVAAGSASLTATVSGNIFSDGGLGMFFQTDETSVGVFTIINNTSRGNTGASNQDGIDLFVAGNSSMTVTVSNNILTDNARRGLLVNVTGAGSFTGTVSGNTFTGNDTGVRLIGTGTTDLGGGTLGSVGQNRLFDNATADITNDSGVEVKAENNWFGADLTPVLAGADLVDTTPVLTSDPGR